MSRHRHIDNEHDKFRAELKATLDKKRERAEKLRKLFDKGKSLFQSNDKQVNRSAEKPVSEFVRQQQAKYSPSIGDLSPRPTPANDFTADKKRAEQEQYLNYRNFEKSMYPGR